MRSAFSKLISLMLAVPVVIAVLLIGVGIYYGGMTIHDLLAENKQLKEAITNLTDEGKIGYAKVLKQETADDGKLWTTIKFVETSRNDPLEKILEKEYTIQGDIIHFDALIVKFGDEMVMEGKKKALYLWRRVYGENMAPSQGYPIEESGRKPERYKNLLKELPDRFENMFWKNIWKLANDPKMLEDYGIKAIYGNVTYSKLRPGLIYVFKLTATGQVYPEVIPDI